MFLRNTKCEIIFLIIVKFLKIILKVISVLKTYLFVYLLLTVLGLGCRAGFFSSYGERASPGVSRGVWLQ